MITFHFCRKRPVNIYGKAISWWADSPYYHVEFVLTPRSQITQRWSASVHNGVHRILDRCSDVLPGWDAVALPTTDGQDAAVVQFVSDEQGCAYDWQGIFLAAGVTWARQHPHKWFCSEFATAAAQRASYGWGLRAYATPPGILFKELACSPLARITYSDVTKGT